MKTFTFDVTITKKLVATVDADTEEEARQAAIAETEAHGEVVDRCAKLLKREARTVKL